MAMMNPQGRVNYEPNSWDTETGPRESAENGFRSYPAEEAGPKLRIRPESFADHYSQARQFYISQTDVEQNHIANALVFELSKVEKPAIRSRMVAHLLNIDEDLANMVAAGLGLKSIPEAAQAAQPTRQDLKASDALSILKNAPQSFKGRKLGVLVTDGVDADLFNALKEAAEAEGAVLEVIAPVISGVEASDGTWIEAAQKVDGGPSVLYDAVALLISESGAEALLAEPTARDFVADAFAHMKFIGYTEAAEPLLEKAGVSLDEACVKLGEKADAEKFVETCRALRFWDRRSKMKAKP